jgi:hypothetical protein
LGSFKGHWVREVLVESVAVREELEGSEVVLEDSGVALVVVWAVGLEEG